MNSIPAHETAPGTRTVEGRGGDVLIEQLRASGVRYIFANPSGHMGPVFDALIDRDDIHLILALQESVLAAMADGFVKAGGHNPFVLVSRPGLPNLMVHLFNAFRDRSSLVVATDQLDESSRGQFGIQEVDDLLQSATPFTRWRWEVRRADRLPEDVRRAFKFAATPPAGPVLLSIPHDFLVARDVRVEIIDQKRFDLSDQVRPAPDLVDKVAERLVAAESPLLYVGPEVHRDGAETAAVRLAETLSLPVVQEPFGWSNAFPTDHALYLGPFLGRMRYPAGVDFMLNLGGKNPPLASGTTQVHVSLDVDSLGRVNSSMLNAMANTRLFAEHLEQAVRQRVTADRVRELRADRGARTAAFHSRTDEARNRAARDRWSDHPISHERLGAELEKALPPDAFVVQLLDAGRIALQFVTFGSGRRSCISTNGQALGWSLGAALGAKLANPERPVVALQGDGDFLFGGSQALWTAQRYRIPITVLILNNRSYDNERNRIWSQDSRQATLNRDMTSYIGSPDVEFTQCAQAYGVAAEKVEHPDQLPSALARAVEANRNGEGFLLDVLVGRRGRGADSTWYPPFSLADGRRRRL